MAEFEHCLHGWPQARRFVVARRFLEPEEAETTLFSMGRYIYRAWVTNLPLTPAGICTSTTDVPGWNHAFANCAKTLRWTDTLDTPEHALTRRTERLRSTAARTTMNVHEDRCFSVCAGGACSRPKPTGPSRPVRRD